MRWSLGRFGFFAVVVAASFADDALAQQPQPGRGDTVASRVRPELEPVGTRVGNFILFPKVTLSEEFNDNIFATEHDRVDDFITILQPELSLESDWKNHSLNFATGLNRGMYFSENGENYLDYFFATDGRLDVTRNIALFMSGGYAHRHEERSNPDDQGGKDPTYYDLYEATGRYIHRFGRFRTIADTQFVRLDYSDTNTFEGPNINNDDRDRNVYQGGVRLGYELTPAYEAFVRVSGNSRDYDHRPDDQGVNRNSTGGEAVTGVSLDLGGLVFGDVYVGYLTQDYPDLPNVSEPTFGLSLDWNVTTLTTVNARVERTVEETTEQDASSYVRTAGTLRADHELLRNLILSGLASIANDDYQGIKRNDDIYTVGLGARYLLNRNFYASLSYRYEQRISDNTPPADGEDDDYHQNVVRIGLEGQL